ncbi:hypothetical protein QC764_404520 [Podospora pseudoanserina]|uniref:Terpene synthase n=1 Tax=Podospora pseudoanserina TaxID=2609844 RepID=A0ABR0IBL0_9PEZI|nr:hypothetical protein QC764_404520 [Podospora pseudoanserina]
MSVVTHTQETPVAQIAALIHGQSLRLPSLQPVLSNWPTLLSPHYAELKKKVGMKIDEWISDERVRRKAQIIDLPLFSSIWYPHATLDRLEMITWYSMWIFLWDDVIEDSATPASGITDKVSWIHHQALKYMEYHLGLSSSLEEPIPPTKYCTLFRYAAEPFRKASSLLQRIRFYEELKVYMDGCEVEQEFVRAGELPSWREYWSHRLGTSSVHTYSALGEYMSGGNIPPEMFDTPELKELWVGINRHIVTVNDLISFKKEVEKSSFHSLVPIVMNETGANLDTVVDSLVDTLRNIGDSMNRAGDRLIALAENSHGAQGRQNMEQAPGDIGEEPLISRTDYRPSCNLHDFLGEKQQLQMHIWKYVRRYGFFGRLNTNTTWGDWDMGLSAPALDISAFCLPPVADVPAGESNVSVTCGHNWQDPLTKNYPLRNTSKTTFASGNRTFTLDYILANGICQPISDKYQWGFSYLQLYIVINVVLLWSTGIFLLWLKAQFNLPLAQYDRVPRELECMLHMSRELQRHFKKSGVES